MNKQTFFSELQAALEVEQIEFNEDTRLKELDGFDSLSIMTIIAFVDENFGKKFSAQQLASINTIKSLMDLIGDNSIEN